MLIEVVDSLQCPMYVNTFNANHTYMDFYICARVVMTRDFAKLRAAC